MNGSNGGPRLGGAKQQGLAAVSLLIAVVAAACNDLGDRSGPVEDNPEQQIVLAEVSSYYSDFSNRDWEAFASHFWPDAILASVWQPAGESSPRVVVTDVAGFVDQAPLGPGSKPIFEEKMISADVRVEGTLAQVWAHYEAKFGDPDDLLTWNGIDAFTLLYHDGVWKITSISFVEDG